ncbi:MAG: lipopolysaccharide heptosyltransferase I, partial [Fimbriimonadaceae bacterium]|nr:lipopolysaccharide heptosyltransferase I [Alphaproteobacteria bacterium]
FAGLAVQHPAINHAIPVRMREIRKQPDAVRNLIAHWRELRQQIEGHEYDLIIDAQGLFKSAVLTRLHPAPSIGFGFGSARESVAVPFYDTRVRSDRNQHAIARTRQLFAAALDYDPPDDSPEYGLDHEAWKKKAIANLQLLALPFNYVVCLHGAAWQTKIWPKERWRKIAENLDRDDINLFLPWGDEEERTRAEFIADDLKRAHVLPRLSIVELAHILSNAEAVVGVDSGLGHIPVAFDIPGLVLIGPTDAKKIGHQGNNQFAIQSTYPKAPCYRRKCRKAEQNLCCMAAISVEEVESKMQTLLNTGDPIS